MDWYGGANADTCHSVGKAQKAVRGDRSLVRLYHTHCEYKILNCAGYSELGADVVAARRRAARLGGSDYKVGGGNRCVCVHYLADGDAVTGEYLCQHL